MENHTFCPLLQLPGVTRLLSRAHEPNISFSHEDCHVILFILVQRVFGPGWLLANYDHFARLSDLVFHEAIPPNLQPLLFTALDWEWRDFRLVNSLD